MTEPATAPVYTVRVYKDAQDKFRWRLVAPNRRIVASSGESFWSRANAERAAARLAGATIVFTTSKGSK